MNYLQRNSIKILRNGNFISCLPSCSLVSNFRSDSFQKQQNTFIHTSSKLNDIPGLSEFFDDKKNWGQVEVRVGRSWKVEELRLKSNEDLHKLWYVLLKEKNMLLTMEDAYKDNIEKAFPNPERLDKVEDSMERLESVVRERNRAYMLLETGKTGERDYQGFTDGFGRRVSMKQTEHDLPDHLNSMVVNKPTNIRPFPTAFKSFWAEKTYGQEYSKIKKDERYVRNLIRHFPDTDLDVLQQTYPHVDVKKMKLNKEAFSDRDPELEEKVY